MLKIVCELKEVADTLVSLKYKTLHYREKGEKKTKTVIICTPMEGCCIRGVVPHEEIEFEGDTKEEAYKNMEERLRGY